MDDFEFIFSNEQYKQLNDEYIRISQPDFSQSLNLLNTAINTLQINNFKMPLALQNEIYNQLSHAQQILMILCKSTYSTNQQLTNNPFSLLNILVETCLQLNSASPNTPYHTLTRKATKLILSAINCISKYFKNKNIKIFNFL